jgi:hypothetical protein
VGLLTSRPRNAPLTPSCERPPPTRSFSPRSPASRAAVRARPPLDPGCSAGAAASVGAGWPARAGRSSGTPAGGPGRAGARRRRRREGPPPPWDSVTSRFWRNIARSASYPDAAALAAEPPADSDGYGAIRGAAGIGSRGSGGARPNRVGHASRPSQVSGAAACPGDGGDNETAGDQHCEACDVADHGHAENAGVQPARQRDAMAQRQAFDGEAQPAGVGGQAVERAAEQEQGRRRPARGVGLGHAARPRRAHTTTLATGADTVFGSPSAGRLTGSAGSVG